LKANIYIEETELCQKAEEKWVKLVAAWPCYLAGRPGHVASQPLPNFLEHLLL
jgi:hypothetical protein